MFDKMIIATANDGLMIDNNVTCIHTLKYKVRLASIINNYFIIYGINVPWISQLYTSNWWLMGQYRLLTANW